MEGQDTKTDIFAIQSTCMEISVGLSCLFVHEPPYQTTVVCCNPVFQRGYSCMDRPTVFTHFPHECGACSGSPQLLPSARQLHITQRTWCDFVVWTPQASEMVVERIAYD